MCSCIWESKKKYVPLQEDNEAEISVVQYTLFQNGGQ